MSNQPDFDEIIVELKSQVPKPLKTSQLRRTWKQYRSMKLAENGVTSIGELTLFLERSFEEKKQITASQLMGLFDDIGLRKMLKLLKKRYFGNHFWSRTRFNLSKRRELAIKAQSFLNTHKAAIAQSPIIPLRSLLKIIKHQDINLVAWVTLKIGLIALELISWLL